MAINTKTIINRMKTQVLPAAAGGVASISLNKVMPELQAKINPKLRFGLKILVGAMLPELSRKTKMLEPFAQGFIAQSAADLAVEFVPAMGSGVSGIGEQASNNILDEEYFLDENVSGTSEEVIQEVNATETILMGTEEVQTY
jgi:hypothetical protein